ncbi:MAG: cytochrome P450 [Actinomycetota bacterium]
MSTPESDEEQVSPNNLPPGPPLGPVSTIRAFRRDPIGLLERAAAFGDVARLRTPRYPTFVLNHPDLVWDVLVTDNRSFHKGPTMDAARRVLGDGLLTSEGEHHRRQRRLIQPLFQPSRLGPHVPVMLERTDRAVERWRDGEVLDFHAEMSLLTLAIVVATVFGSNLSEREARAVSVALTEVLAQYPRSFSPFLRLTERLPLPANRRFERATHVFDGIVYRLIERRRADGAGGDDLLSRLIRAQDEEGAMTAAQLRDEAITLFLAGHETTSNALSWAWWLLARTREAEERLHAEADAVELDGAPDASAADRLPFARAVLDESMRRYPPAWAIGRRSTEPHRAGGYELPARAVTIVSPWLLHHDPRWWKEPDAFAPERWLEPDPDRPRAAFLPFGAGPRMCVGEPFARLEAVLLLARIARRWRFAADPSAEVGLQPAITLRPRGGMRMRALERTGRGSRA